MIRPLYLPERDPAPIKQEVETTPGPVLTLRRKENLLLLPGIEP
jgi:hypothetical protein